MITLTVWKQLWLVVSWATLATPAILLLTHLGNLIRRYIMLSWRVSEAHETLYRGIGYIRMCVDVRRSFCTLTLTFLCSLGG